jgi:hypothetical protein
VDALPMPQGVLDLLDEKPQSSAGSTVVPFPARAERRFLQWPMAIAASVALVAGFLLHDLVRNASSVDSVDAILAGEISEATAVHSLLESGLSTEPQVLADGATGRLLLTFQDGAGDYCREFRLDSEARTVRAVACRRAGSWLLETLAFEPAATAGGEYQQASAGGSAAVNAAIDALIGGNEPLDAAAESRLVQNGWKNID